MKKGIMIFLSLVVSIGLILAFGLWYLGNQPLYRPGMVREAKNLSASLKPPTQSDIPNFWQVEEDIQLYYFTHGEGRTVLVVHGGPGIPFRQTLSGLEPLADRLRFNYYDQRGCGKSTRPFDRFDSPNVYENMTTLDRKLGLGAQIADIERIRQILGEEKLILIGHSWGGFLAVLYAAEFPERVEALVLISPATALVLPQEEADLFDTVRVHLPKAQQAEFEAFMEAYLDFGSLFQKSETELIELNARFGDYYLAVIDTPSQDLPEQGEPGGWMSWAMYLSMGKRHDYRSALKNVTAPVLVLHGAQDLQSEAASRQYAELFPNAIFTVIQDAGHFVFEEQPDVFAIEIAKFLNSH